MYRWLDFGTRETHVQMTAAGMKTLDEITISTHPRLVQ